MATQYVQGYIDQSRESSKTTFYVEDITTATAVADSITAATNIKGALAIASLCNFTNARLSHEFDDDGALTPNNDYAQREIGLFVQYIDSVTGAYGSTVIPGADLTLYAQANTDEVDIISNVAALALITVLEANAVSRDDNPIDVTRMRVVGRRS